MTPTRREFMWAAGMSAAAWALQDSLGVVWTSEEVQEAGWEPGVEGSFSSTCLLCPARCGIRSRTVDGRLVRITGNPLHPMSRGGVCPRGVGGVQILYHPDRLRSPRVRVGDRGAGQWREISSDEAIALIVDRLRPLRSAGRPEALALVAGFCAGTVTDVWRQFLTAFGSPNYVSDDYPDETESVMALMHGIPRRPGYDLDRAGLVVSFGAPLFEAWWSPLQAFVAFGRPGTGEAGRPRFVQVDTRFSRTATRSHEWVGVRPGTHAVLALGIAYVLIKEQLYNAEFVGAQVLGFEDYAEADGRVREGYRSLVLRHYRTEEVSAVTGVPVERIVSLARAFAAARPPLAVLGADVMQAPDGLLAGLAVHSLNVLMGSVNRAGGVVFGTEPPLAPLVGPPLDGTARAGLARPPIGGAPASMGTGDRPRRFAEAIAAGSVPAPEALFLYYANPLAASPQPEAWRAALSRIPFVVSFSPFLDETTRHADLVLPDLLPYERWQDAPTPTSFPYPVWGIARPLVEPQPGGCVHTGEAVFRIAHGVGGSVGRSLPYQDFQALLKARAHGLFAAERGMTLGDEFRRTHYRQMEERGWWLAEHTDFDSFWDDLVERGGWADLFYDDTDPAGLARTRSGRIELMPATLLRALDAEGQSRAPYVLTPGPTTGAETYPLLLIPYRLSTLSSGTLGLESWLAEQPTILSERHWIPWVEIHPATAAALGFEPGTMVWVVSAHGRYRARLTLFPGTAPGTLNAPYGPRHPDGELANPLQLLDGSTDPLTGRLCWFTTRVRLERA